MKKANIKSKKGFTIIEVVLVLAIAGLIFLMVFVALPNLQRNQRDTTRKNDVDRLSSILVSYASTNNKLPSNNGTGSGSAIGGTIGGTTSDATDPTIESFVVDACNTSESATGGSESDSSSCINVKTDDPWREFALNYILNYSKSDKRAMDEFLDPNGDPYSIAVVSGASGSVDVGEDLLDKFGGGVTQTNGGAMVIAVAASCADVADDGFIHNSNDGKRSFAVAMHLEAGGVYCVDN